MVSHTISNDKFRHVSYLAHPKARKTREIVHRCIPQNKAPGVCRRSVTDISVSGIHRTKNMVNATMRKNHECLPQSGGHSGQSCLHPISSAWADAWWKDWRVCVPSKRLPLMMEIGVRASVGAGIFCALVCGVVWTRSSRGSPHTQVSSCFSMINLFLMITAKKKKKKKKSVLKGTVVYVFVSCACHSELTEVNSFQTDTKGRLFGVDVSTNWPSDRNWQTKVLDSWKATQLNLLRKKSINGFSQ